MASASERLRALEAIKPLDWPAPSHTAYRESENALANKSRDLIDALPEIIAVVEAAEVAGVIRRDETVSWVFLERLISINQSLDALASKLSGEGQG